MRRSPVLVGVVLGILVGAGGVVAVAATGSGSASSASNPAHAHPTAATAAGSGRLFVQTALSGTLTPSSDGSFALHLVGVPATIWFTDRPARASGTEDTAQFVQSWGQGAGNFAARPPNAVLEAREGNTRRVLPVELTSATFHADGSTLDYTLRALPRSLGFYQSEGTGTRFGPGAFGNATVFIDDAPTPACWVSWGILTGGVAVVSLSGGTFLYTYGNEIQELQNGALLAFQPDTNFSGGGVNTWQVGSTIMSFTSAPGAVEFLTWIQPNPGAKTVTVEITGFNGPPTEGASSLVPGGCNVTGSSNTQTAYFFTISV